MQRNVARAYAYLQLEHTRVRAVCIKILSQKDRSLEACSMKRRKKPQADKASTQHFCPRKSKSKERTMGVLAEQENVVPAERHYTVIEVAEIWNLSPDKVRELFEHEPGVLVIGDRNPHHKRRYLTLRIPQTVLQRVHNRLAAKPVHL
jgi:hypothetical protein